MPKFLIEVQHHADPIECARVIQVFLETGSHFLAQADWGCGDGVHSAYMVVDLDSKQDALMVVPPPYRSKAKVVGLNKFVMSDIEPILKTHPKAGAAEG